jgi:hypothetical protein
LSDHWVNTDEYYLSQKLLAGVDLFCSNFCVRHFSNTLFSASFCHTVRS